MTASRRTVKPHHFLLQYVLVVTEEVEVGFLDAGNRIQSRWSRRAELYRSTPRHALQQPLSTSEMRLHNFQVVAKQQRKQLDVLKKIASHLDPAVSHGQVKQQQKLPQEMLPQLQEQNEELLLFQQRYQTEVRYPNSVSGSFASKISLCTLAMYTDPGCRSETGRRNCT